MNYWLMKSEPTVYGLDDLERDQQTLWDGVRNYQARNYLRQMAVGDRAFFYHSNTKPPGIVGLMTITAVGIVDPTQFDPSSDYHDPKASPDAPRWQTVTVTFGQRFDHCLTLDQLKATISPDELGVVRRGNRLSVMPVTIAIAHRLLVLGGLNPSIPGT
ncbi:EVE domain-containing protein [Prochlorothrix hollandica]|uniref:Thymocyte nuclear protein 1 n=1 Tax=Prochlorothrix hollandica PCC 9006 = CALU 1027 TaxID=317619 RepID=A0A0M2Q133_PROHO|nr:EVE domain-containing protein [Prochlorothrix hollandica]KKJ01018.1 thymocyte nuclear protein 1 [Prochlorothrix hollandica PCC 9006 = CALU 1027]